MKTFTGKNAITKCVADAQRTMIKAGVATVNQQAYNTFIQSKENFSRNFIERNTFTKRNFRYTKCQPGVTSINQIQSVAGVTTNAPYTQRLEQGGAHIGKPRLAIPNRQARTGSSNEKQVQSRYYLGTIKPLQGPYRRKGTRKSNLVASAAASKSLNMRFKIGNTWFVTTSFSKAASPKFKLKPLYNVAYKSTNTSAKPFLKPAADLQAMQGQAIFNEKMKYYSK
jgi:hypothetical protein